MENDKVIVHASFSITDRKGWDNSVTYYDKIEIELSRQELLDAIFPTPELSAMEKLRLTQKALRSEKESL